MVPEIKEAVVKALRSGDYKQGRGQLRAGQSDGDGGTCMLFCCLGVIYDITHPNEWLEDSEFSGSINYGTTLPDEDIDSFGENTAELSPGQLREIGLSATEQRALVCMNDGNAFPVGSFRQEGVIQSSIDPKYIAGKEPKSFEEIATYIEENL